MHPAAVVVIVACLVVGAGCTDGDQSGPDSPPSTDTEGEPSPADEMATLAAARGITLTEAADDEAAYLCATTDANGPNQAEVLALRAWEDGVRPNPADDLAAFVPLAAEVYCPEHADLFGR